MSSGSGCVSPNRVSRSLLTVHRISRTVQASSAKSNDHKISRPSLRAFGPAVRNFASKCGTALASKRHNTHRALYASNSWLCSSAGTSSAALAGSLKITALTIGDSVTSRDLGVLNTCANSLDTELQHLFMKE